MWKGSCKVGIHFQNGYVSWVCSINCILKIISTAANIRRLLECFISYGRAFSRVLSNSFYQLRSQSFTLNVFVEEYHSIFWQCFTLCILLSVLTPETVFQKGCVYYSRVEKLEVLIKIETVKDRRPILLLVSTEASN